MTSQEVIIEEATVADARGICDFLAEITEESNFIVGTPFSLSDSDMATFLLNQSEENDRLCLLVKQGNHILGLLNLMTSPIEELRHIGDIFIAVRKAYRGNGLGSDLMSVLLDWAEHTPSLQRLELTVQARNECAVHLYKKCGFVIEGVQKRGIKTETGDFGDVYLMGKLLD